MGGQMTRIWEGGVLRKMMSCLEFGDKYGKREKVRGR